MSFKPTGRDAAVGGIGIAVGALGLAGIQWLLGKTKPKKEVQASDKAS